jgi:hypothetical protein
MTHAELRAPGDAGGCRQRLQCDTSASVRSLALATIRRCFDEARRTYGDGGGDGGDGGDGGGGGGDGGAAEIWEEEAERCQQPPPAALENALVHCASSLRLAALMDPTPKLRGAALGHAIHVGEEGRSAQPPGGCAEGGGGDDGGEEGRSAQPPARGVR